MIIQNASPPGHKWRKPNTPESRNLVFALAGNANVGKSVLFNHLTGSSQIIGNWPGKTIERAQGTLEFEGQKIIVVDLPGIYSFSTFSMEEIVSREYIALENPDVVINVVDAAILERNLFFTIQLMEMEVPLVLCLNQLDAAKKKGITIDLKKLEQTLGVPVVPTVAIRGEGIYELTKKAVEMAKRKGSKKPKPVRYGSEIEEKIQKLTSLIQSKKIAPQYPPRWVAVKLLENDPEIKKLASSNSQDILREADVAGEEIFQIHKEQAFAVIASERYALASKIANEAQKQAIMKTTLSDKLEWVTTHRVLGYFTSVGVIAGLLLWTFTIGNLLSTLLSDALKIISPVNPCLERFYLGRSLERNFRWHSSGHHANHPIRYTVLPDACHDRGFRHPHQSSIHDGQRHAQNRLARKSPDPTYIGFWVQRSSHSLLSNNGNQTRTSTRCFRHHICAMRGQNNPNTRTGCSVLGSCLGACTLCNRHRNHIHYGKSGAKSRARAVNRIDNGDALFQSSIPLSYR